jgi:hypothetical protein
MLLTSTSDLIRGQSDQNADFEIIARYFDNNAGTITPGRPPNQSITNTTQTTLVGSPASSVQRLVDFISIKNNHASQAANFTIDHFDGSVASESITINLLAGETAIYTGQWVHYDVNGNPYTTVGPVASQAEMEAGTSLTTFVTPGRQHFHPSAAKFWVKASPGSTINASYNVTSTADATAGVLDITIATDFSGSHYAIVAMSLRTGTGTLVTDTKNTAIRSGTQAAGTVSVETYDNSATNVAIEDPTSWYAVGFGDL